ncbi:MAG: class I SAM-dependent methyltransferase [Acidimicrobiia bacterium]|nr:class I SAM-dependent methyltransferase [Acidimicrobiia bacterium]
MTLAALYEELTGPDCPIAFRAHDGSAVGGTDAPATVVLHSVRGLRHMVSAPGQLGLARAYVSGELDIEGDLYAALGWMLETPLRRKTVVEQLALARRLPWGAFVPIARPAEEVRLHNGPLHSLRRDAAAISHHYDVSNEFYRMVLGPTMAYTCACFPTDDTSLDTAQLQKFDLVCRKLDLQPGERLLDVGCGWGGMVLHATEHYGVTALGVTLSRQQAEWAQKQIADRGLADRAEVRHLDYRDVTVDEGPFDAISSIGLTEHIGAEELHGYFTHLYGLLRPAGRLLNHAIHRPRDNRTKLDPRGFMNRYVFPDAELEAVTRVMAEMPEVGFEIRHEENLREHYAKTLRHWTANLEENWEACVAEAGEGRTRVWRLYLAGCALLFERNLMQLHQVLCTKTTPSGDSGMSLRGWARPST